MWVGCFLPDIITQWSLHRGSRREANSQGVGEENARLALRLLPDGEADGCVIHAKVTTWPQIFSASIISKVKGFENQIFQPINY